MAEGRDIFDIMLDVDIAHALMLGKQGIISSPVLRGIIKGLEDIRAAGFEGLPVDVALEDLHYNVEKNLIDRTGMDVGGRMHTARSRNDLAATTTRLLLREKCLHAQDLLCKFREELLSLGEQHAGTVMTIYTHMQPAQPVTFGYYLAGFAASLERDFRRLASAYANNNRNPLGSGAVAGTSFPVDRQYTADLLGFDSYIPNSIDAIASKDHVLELLSAMDLMMVNISRVAYDLYVWTTDEFNMIGVSDSIAATSSIMPQKKNPITFEHIKSKAAHVHAALTSAVGVLKNTPFSHSRDVAREAIHLAADAFNETFVALTLFTVTLRHLQVKKDVMLEKTRANFSTATELADVLVQEYGVSFRQAHHIVGALVSELLEKRLTAEDISPVMLAEASKAVVGKPLDLDADRLRKILDPSCNVERRTGDGNTAPADVLRAVAAMRHKLQEDIRTTEGFRKSIAESRAFMKAEEAKIHAAHR